MMVKKNLVYIVGFMGSGKSTTGEKIASLLGWLFIDLDRKIEEYTGRSIPEVFSQLGETYFRNVESEVLKDINTTSYAVVATGGGTPCHSGNMDIMNMTGLTVYLKLTPDQLCSRLSTSKGERPLIKGLSNESLLAYIKKKLAEREKWYNSADIILEGSNTDINKLLSAVKSRLNL